MLQSNTLSNPPLDSCEQSEFGRDVVAIMDGYIPLIDDLVDQPVFNEDTGFAMVLTHDHFPCSLAIVVADSSGVRTSVSYNVLLAQHFGQPSPVADYSAVYDSLTRFYTIIHESIDDPASIPELNLVPSHIVRAMFAPLVAAAH